jgi:mannan endo-1,4-beta-mannosidase
MRTAQASLSRFLPLIEWTRFRRRNLNEEIGLSEPGVAAFACGDDRQAIVWLLRTNSLDVRGKITPKAKSVQVSVPGLDRGCFRIVIFDTITGRLVGERQIKHRNLGGGAGARSRPER